MLPLTALLLFGFSEKRQIEKWDPTEKVLTLDENASPSDLKTYHELAKKYNAIPIEKRIIPLEDLKELERIYRKMDETQKENALPFPECSPKEEGQKTVEFIEIFINNNGKLLFQSNIVPLEDLKETLSKVNEHLSFDQRKKVVRSVIQVEAQTPKNVIQQVDKILTEYGSATINIVGPETSMQSSATREEMKEYNALAKKYNAMDRNHMVIKKQEVNRLKEIYGKMSQKQQEDAEPFPNFPPPPPAPDAPEPVQHAPATEAAIPSPPGVMPAQEPNSALPAPPTSTRAQIPFGAHQGNGRQGSYLHAQWKRNNRQGSYQSHRKQQKDQCRFQRIG